MIFYSLKLYINSTNEWLPTLVVFVILHVVSCDY